MTIPGYVRLASACIAVLVAGRTGARQVAPVNAIRVHGNRPAIVERSAVIGHVGAGETIEFAIGLPPRNQAALDALVRQLYDRNDPNYGHYLKPKEFIQRFGPTADDYESVAAFAAAHRLKIKERSAGRTLMLLEAASRDVEAAFGVHMMRYRSPDGREFRAPDADPSLPSEIATRVSAIVGLDDLAHFHPIGVRPPAGAGSRAQIPDGSGPSGATIPSDLPRAYNLLGFPNAGAGQTLGLIEFDGYTASDPAYYAQYFGLRAVPLTNIMIDGYNGAPGGGSGEVTLDIELQNALAPGATQILVYEAPNSEQASLDLFDRIANDDLTNSISMSWGQNELDNPLNDLTIESNYFEQYAAQGQSVFVSSGDGGNYGTGPTLYADDPATQPYATAVGGTSLKTAGLYYMEDAWTYSGGGISGFWPIPWYQQAPGVITAASLGSNTYRNVPDVALNADVATGYLYYINGVFQEVGGTSCSTPLWAAFMATVNENRAMMGLPALGFADPEVYNIGTGPNYDYDFHDIATGTTNHYYPAVTGYDLVTGWGLVNGANLIFDLVDQNRTPWAWGDNSSGQFGNGGSGQASTGQPTLGPASVSAISTGYNFTLALAANGTVWSWGFNGYGELGNGSFTTSGSELISTPVVVSVLGPAAAISAGGYHSVAIQLDGTLWSWGNNQFGQLGNGTTTTASPYGVATPAQVTIPAVSTPSVAVAAGTYHSLYLGADDSVYAWGNNAFGQLGSGNTTTSPTPALVGGLPTPTPSIHPLAITAGGEHSVVLESDGSVWGWGDGSYGELGTGAAGVTTTPIQIAGLSNVVAIAAGGFYQSAGGFTLALESDGTVWALGANNLGQLGNGTFTNSSIATQVVGVSNAVAIATGAGHGLALLSNGIVMAWGADDAGQLGNGTINGVTGNPTPAPVQGLAGAVLIAAGSHFSFALGPGAVGSVSGTVTLYGAVTQNVSPINVTLHASGAAPISRSVTLASDGSFTIAGVPLGVYNIGFKGPKWLERAITNVTVSGAVGGVNATLLPGDLNDDNVVDISDFSIFVSAFGTALGDPNWNTNADFNCDGVVDISDFSLLAADFGLSGDPRP